MTLVPGAVLMMDVTNSSQCMDTTAITRGLDTIAAEWMRMGEAIGQRIAVVHRRGDELFLVADNYATAYQLAFWTHLLWPLREFPLYGAMSFGDLSAAVPQCEDLERWNSPMVKGTRKAMNLQQATKKSYRPWLCFGSTYAVPDGNKLVQQLNEDILLQHRLLQLQSMPQKQAGVLHLLGYSRTEAAKVLHKDVSTISRQVRQSNSDLVAVLYKRVVNLLHFAQHETDCPAGPSLESMLRETSKEIAIRWTQRCTGNMAVIHK